MSKTPQPQQNHLLAALSFEAQTRLFPHLEVVSLSLGKVLYEPGQVMHYAYFPTDSIVSLLYVMDNGESAEIAVVGNEGLIGVPLFMGGESTSISWFVNKGYLTPTPKKERAVDFRIF